MCVYVSVHAYMNIACVHTMYGKYLCTHTCACDKHTHTHTQTHTQKKDEEEQKKENEDKKDDESKQDKDKNDEEVRDRQGDDHGPEGVGRQCCMYASTSCANVFACVCALLLV